MNARRSILMLTAIATLVAMTPTSGLGQTDPEAKVVGDITHVAHVSWGGARGSDLEFASREVTKLSDGATGVPVCATDADGSCLTDENGDTIHETEVRDFVVAGVYGNGRIVDVTDPRNPVVVAQIPCNATQHDIQIQDDLLLVAQDSGSGTCTKTDGSNQPFQGSAVLDFSDPRDPTFVSHLPYDRGSHNHTFHPIEPLVYLSDSDVLSTTGNVPVWDVSDPANPQLVTEFQHLVHSPHDITFSADGTRAYVAAVSATYILNTEDPEDPQLISTIANEGISISHQSDPTPDGKFLLVSDELGGGAAGVPPGGAVHVYDIRDEEHPVKVGLIWNDCLQETCQSVTTDGAPISTSHVFRINPDGYTMAIGWYKDGVHVIDYSGIRGANAAGTGAASNVGPRVLASIKMPDARTWAAKMWQERHPGYVFANDSRGLDVFYMPELDNGFIAYGTIAGAHPGNFNAGAGVTRNEWESECDYTPRTSGVDGWVAKIPAEHAGGGDTITATGQGLGFDLDMYFYDESCFLTGAEEDPELNETGEIPPGTAYVMVTNYLGTTNPVENPVHVRLSVS